MTADPPLCLLSADDIAVHLDGLAGLLQACILAGASIGFIMPHGREDSEAFWTRKVLPALRDGSSIATCRQTSRTAPRSANCWSIPISAARASPVL